MYIQHYKPKATWANHFWFTVVASNPEQWKRTVGGTLRKGDIGLAVHEPLSVREEGVGRPTKVLLSTTPVNCNVATVQNEVTQLPLILAPSALSFDDLKLLNVWERTGGLQYRLDFSMVPAIPKLEATLLRQLEFILSSLVDAPDGLSLPGNLAQHKLRLRCMERLLEHEIVHRTFSSIDDSAIWSLSTTGKERLLVAQTYVSRGFALRPRPLPVEQLHAYELLVSLEEDGWLGQVFEKSMGRSKLEPYVIDKEPKVWYVKRPDKDPPRLYLVALAKAPVHKLPVPHFAKTEEYEKILNMQPSAARARRKAKTKRLRTYAENEEWPDEPPKPVKRARKARRPTYLPPDSEEGSSSTSSASSMPTPEPSPDPVRPDSGRPDPPDDGKGLGKGRGRGGRGRGVVHDVGSESSGESDSGPKWLSDLGQRRVFRPRHTDTRLPFGLSWLTPKYGQEGTVTDYTMTCKHPLHNDGVKCTKPIRTSKAGGDDIAIRMLKLWMVHGWHAKNKDGHLHMWPVIEAAVLGQSMPLPSEKQLDTCAPLAWPAALDKKQNKETRRRGRWW